MRLPLSNSGVVITGGTVHGNVAAGPFAQAGNRGASASPEVPVGLDEVSALWQEVRAVLEAARPQLDDPELVERLAADIDTELGGGTPDEKRLLARLTAIGALVSSVAGISAALSGLVEAVKALFA